jgi:hypothetical protein
MQRMRIALILPTAARFIHARNRQPPPNRDKTAHIPRAPLGLIRSLQKGNVTEIPCFRLKHAFEFQSRV